MTKCFKLSDDAIRCILEFCEESADSLKKSGYSVKRVASLFQNNATGYIFVGYGQMVLTSEPAKIENILEESTSAEEAIKKIKGLS